jgi:hypothetical protein
LLTGDYWGSSLNGNPVFSPALNPGYTLVEMNTTLTLIGIIVLIMGLVFIGQGSGYFPWPASSFMINQSKWIYYGGGIALAGLLLIVFARR